MHIGKIIDEHGFVIAEFSAESKHTMMIELGKIIMYKLAHPVLWEGRNDEFFLELIKKVQIGDYKRLKYEHFNG